MYHNIEKNWSRPGYHGWDLSGRHWCIQKTANGRWRAWLRSADTTAPVITSKTLKGISVALAETCKPLVVL